MKATNTTGTAASVFEFICQRMEGLDTAQLDFGTSSAKQITLSFFVKSSVTGTYNVALRNNANDRGYVADYTISSANTWEKKVITIPGDTTGTWLTTNGIGIRTWFILGAGASSQTSPNAWGTSGDSGSSNLTNAFTTTGSATFFLTGVQMEVGDFDANSIAPFQHESFGDSLLRCQRYLYDPLRGADSFGVLSVGACVSTTVCRAVLYAPAEMRTRPTIVTSGDLEVAGSGFSPAVTANAVSVRTGTQAIEVQFTVSSGLTANAAAMVRRDNNDTAQYRLDAEL